MEQLMKATLWVTRRSPQEGTNNPEEIPVQFNPTEFTLDKSAQIAEIPIPGLDAPLQQFVRGQAEKLTLDLFFDTTDQGMGDDAVSVTTQTDRIYQLIKIEPTRGEPPTRHAPPICTLVWNAQFPGNAIGGPTGDGVGNQKRNGFQCIVESVKQKFTLFSPKGVPLRATLTVTLREYKTLQEQLDHLGLGTPRTRSHVVQQGETLSSLAAQSYGRPGEWRSIADANDIEDPRRMAVGTFLTIPSVP
ncbi:MAG: CIS tube protein [Candidatus Entotheonellia bacterium]